MGSANLMKVMVTIAARFDRGPDGRIFRQSPPYTFDFFKRYLEVFEEVRVAGRIFPAREAGWRPLFPEPSDGPGVSFVDIPPFTGISDLIRFLPRIRSAFKDTLAECEACILRVPDFLGTLACQEIRRQGRPFAVEVVGDPADSLQAGSVRHPLRPLIRLLGIRYLRRQCAAAAAASYVTKQALQHRYPPGRQTYQTHYSSLNLPESLFIEQPRCFTEPASHLVHVGTFEAFYKGPDILVEALALLADRGKPLHLTFVGDGRRRPELEARIQSHGLERQVIFLGKLPAGAAVAAAMDTAQIFVLPSLQEGLPRVIIEAMARGLPCIATTVGGIPELLPPEDLVEPKDAPALADKIMEVALNPARMTRMSARNLEVAGEYLDKILHGRRQNFYRQVLEISRLPQER
jgi:glycosyltransferase involved in cell wall biosynthesis